MAEVEHGHGQSRSQVWSRWARLTRQPSQLAQLQRYVLLCMLSTLLLSISLAFPRFSQVFEHRLMFHACLCLCVQSTACGHGAVSADAGKPAYSARLTANSSFYASVPAVPLCSRSA